MKEIILFGKALKQSTLSFSEVNSEATKKGYIIHPDCCNGRVMNWLKTLPINHNSTFYKSWQDVTSKSRFELFLDQILHYSTTYGSNFQDTPYIPNDNPELVPFTDYKVISPITISEIQEKIQSLFNSGIALKQETIEDCLSLVDEFDILLNYKEIKNKEVACFLYKKLNILPEKPEELVRYFVYLYTEKTLLIKDKIAIYQIKSATMNKEISYMIEKFGIEKLAQVFHRYKPLLLAMKRGNEKTINKLRKLADKYHKPYVQGYFEKILLGDVDITELDTRLNSINNYKKIALLKAIKVRQTETSIMPVTIRNGKIWIEQRKFENKSYYQLIYDMIYRSLIKSLSTKACKIKLNDAINIALPTSEKNFIGSIPFGSYVELGDKDAIIGINWKGVDGASDLDLALLNESGSKIGWNSSYYNDSKSIVFSGDMTSANPEATELMYAKNGFSDSLVFVNLYSGQINSKLTYFFAKVDKNYVAKSQMVDPNNIVFQTQLEMTSKEMIFGFNTNNRFYFSNIRMGNKRVGNGETVTQQYVQYAMQTCNTFIYLKDVLKDAGFEFVKDKPDIDLTVMDKSLLIGLLS